MLLRTFKVTYLVFGLRTREREVVLEATSKYDAKQRFYRQYPKCEIIRVEVVEE